MAKKKTKTFSSPPLKAEAQIPESGKSVNSSLYILLLLVFTFIVFSPAIKCDFVNWDDDRNTYENKLVLEHKYAEIFTQNVIGNYNPLSILSFAIEHSIYGMNASRMHLVNILLHLICVYFVFKIFQALKLNVWFALIGAALFAFHPLRVESVAWITERKDVLYGAFYCPALYLYIRNLDKPAKWKALLAFSLFIIGLFAKIQMVALPLSMLAVDYYKDRPLNFKLILEKVHYFLAAFLFGIIGILFLKDQGSLETNSMVHTGIDRLFIGSYSLITYCIKWLVPYMMSPLYPYPEKLSMWHYLSLPAAIIMLYGIYYAYKKNAKALVFGFMFFFFNIVFLLQILAAGQGYLADRFTYIAYIGLFFVFCFYTQKWLFEKPKMKSIGYAALGIYLVVLSFISYNQTKIWKNSETLWTHVLKYYQNTPLPYNNRANYLRDLKQFDRALEDYNMAIKYKAGHATYNSRARLFFNKNEDQKAIQDYDQAIKMKPEAEYYVNRGAAKAKLGRWDEALSDINKGLELNKNWKVGYLNRSILYNQAGKTDLALADIDSYLKLDSKSPELWFEGARCLVLLNQAEKALSYFNNAIRLNPNSGLFYSERGQTLQSLGKIDAANQDFQRAQQLGQAIQ
ncbi:MAG: tetratricopeptide repeat protein [Saprospiraceae bacterium]|jgi:tetratricopeptide (TPR) repeat protein